MPTFCARRSPPSAGRMGWPYGRRRQRALLAPLIVALMLFVIFVVARAISKLGSAERRTADIWLCGYAKEAEVHRYGAHNLYGEVKKYFGWVGGMPKQPGPRR